MLYDHAAVKSFDAGRRGVMAKSSKLKVYRTSIGFHDAYVAAPSQKAALAAWGSDKDLFARGAAETVTDEALIAAPLSAPGKVIKRLRGTAAEQMAALPPDPPKSSKTAAQGTERKESGRRPRKAAPPPPPPPPPSREALEAAEALLDDLEKRGQAQIADLDRQQANLAKERKRTLAELEKARDRLTATRDDEARRYDRAITRW